MHGPQILVVDDEPGVRDLISDALSLISLNTVQASHGMQALSILRENTIDLVVLDINMPVMNGFEVLERIRSHDDRTPVIVLTARQDREDIKKAFELGADDFVRKPFGIEELTLRVSAILRRSAPTHTASDSLTVGEVSLHNRTHQVFVAGEARELSPTEFRLLKVFMSNKNTVLSKETLLARVWGTEAYADPNTVETYVSYLRKKIGDSINIRNVRGVGYQLLDPTPELLDPTPKHSLPHQLEPHDSP